MLVLILPQLIAGLENATLAAGVTAASVTCDHARSCVLLPGGGDSLTATAWAVLKQSSANKTGWSELRVDSREGVDDRLAAYGAGYVEGALTTVGNWQQFRNYFETTFSNTSDPLYFESRRFLEDNDAFMNVSCQDPKPEWSGKCLVWAQLDGLVAGHQEHAAPAEAMSRLDFLFVNALVDISSLIHKPFAMSEWTAERAARHLRLTTQYASAAHLHNVSTRLN